MQLTNTAMPLVMRRTPITVEEYLCQRDTGVIDPDARVELIEGEIFELPMAGPSHNRVVSLLTRELVLAAHRFAAIWIQNVVQLGPLSMPQPDAALLKGNEDRYGSRHVQPDEVLLAIEVSDSTLRRDLTVKVPLYARFGLPESWVIDLPNEQFHIFRSPRNGEYREKTSIRRPRILRLAALPDVEVDVSKVFAPA